MKILVFGKTGQLASELSRQCPQNVDITFIDRQDADLSAPQVCSEAILNSGADAVINAAAWTDVDGAEDHEDTANIINGITPSVMAEACKAINAAFLHVSTDYVFDGKGHLPSSENRPTQPVNAYGRSKLLGEIGVHNSGANYAILRTSWVISAHGKNFAKTMLRLGASKDHLRVVNDQIGSPTPASSIAQALFTVAKGLVSGKQGGIYHFTGQPITNWAEIASEIMSYANLPCVIEGIPTSEYPTKAERPLNSRLDCTKIYTDFGIEQPNWKVELKHIINELGAST